MGCGDAASTTTSAVTPEPTAPTAMASSDAPLGAGTHCFSADVTVGGETMQEVVKMTVDSMGTVEGMISVAEVSGPEDPGLNSFNAVLEGQTLTVHMWNGLNKGDDPWDWDVSSSRLNDGTNTFQAVDCATVDSRFPSSEAAAATPAAAPSAPSRSTTASASAAPSTTPTPSNVPESEVMRFQPSDLTGGPTASDVVPVEVTNFETIPVQFPRGSDRATFSTSITEIEAHSYELQARAGQLMEIDMSAEDDVSYFSVYAPTGVVMVREALGSVAIQLPMDGVYYVGVHTYGTNDRYTLTVRIR
ncbi:hypothetical protein GFS31_08820 [Leptolyngbya sp. BL0902]|nr:hypothetical protein GFS31_08820 [Leptolyngbya sp. BL0902]